VGLVEIDAVETEFGEDSVERSTDRALVTDFVVPGGYGAIDDRLASPVGDQSVLKPSFGIALSFGPKASIIDSEICRRC
jgi:hypothetical protein